MSRNTTSGFDVFDALDRFCPGGRFADVRGPADVGNQVEERLARQPLLGRGLGLGGRVRELAVDRTRDLVGAIGIVHLDRIPADQARVAGAFVQSFLHQVDNTGAILSAIAAVVFLVILLIAGNTMAQAVRERTSELGVLKTLGFTDTTVIGLVLGESLLVAGVGGVLGLALVALAAPAVGKLVATFLPVFFVPARAIAVGVGLALLLGVATGGLPAWSAQRLSVVEALRRR
jgi:putative ABC transport system permease protein